MDTKTIVMVCLEIWGIVICAILFILLSLTGKRTKIDKDVRWLLLTGTVLLCADIFAHVYRGCMVNPGYYLVRAGNFGVYLINYLLPCVYAKYVFDIVQPGNWRKQFLYHIIWFICGVSVILLIISQFTDLFYYYDEHNCYIRGDYFVLSQIASVVCIVCFIIIFFSARKKIRKNILIAGTTYLFLPMIATFIQFFVYGLPLQSMADITAIIFIVLMRELEVRNELEEANKAKSTFFFNMSHDIRTPMNVIMGFTKLAMKVENNPELTKEYLQKMTLAEQNLLGLINNVLEMARIENNKYEFHEVVVDCSHAIEKSLTIFENQAKGKNITLVGSIDIKNPYIYEDESTDAQTALNIISNAIKYTPNGGRVEISLTQGPGRNSKECSLTFVCKDNGIGMSEEFLQHAFDNFSRENTSTISKIQGVGLGLGIVKKLVEVRGGSINLESKKGVGTTVTVKTYHRYGSKELLSEQTKEQNNTISLEGKKILLVEDNELNLEIAQAILKENGAIITPARNGREACEIIATEKADAFDVVLMDVQMPVMNGYEATKIIRDMDDMQKALIPIIAMTANAFAEDVRNAAEAGMNGHIAKPIDVQQMLNTLSTILKD